MDGKTLAKETANSLNSFNFSPKDFCDVMKHEHKTLQQSFTRLCRDWLLTCADESYDYDGRNEASHEFGKMIKDLEVKLPFI